MAGRRPDRDEIRDDEDYSAQLPFFGKDEMNLAEFPVALLRRQSDSRTSFSYEGYVKGPDGVRHKQKWTVHGLSGMGLPNEYDERVLIALMAVSAGEGFRSRKVPFSVYRILKIMGLTDSVRDYRNIERSLERLTGVTIIAEGAFWDNGAKGFIKHKSAFHIIERFWLAYKEEDDSIREAEGVQAYFIWSDDLWQSIKDGYIKTLDLSFYYSLKTPLARRLYRFLDKRLHKHPHFEIDIFELAGRLGMAAYKYPSQVLEKLQPAVDELIREHYLAAAGDKKVKEHLREYTRLWVEKYGGDAAVPLAAPSEAEDLPAPIVLEMMEFGVSRTIAIGLAERFDADYIAGKIAYLRHRLRRNRRAIRNPSGWLRKAIEEDFTLPEGDYTEQLLFDTQESAPPEVEEFHSDGTGLSAVTLEAETAPFLRSTWRRVLQEMQVLLTPDTFEHLFARTTLLELDARSALVDVPDPGAREWIERRFTTQLEQALATVTGRNGIRVRLIAEA